MFEVVAVATVCWLSLASSDDGGCSDESDSPAEDVGVYVPPTPQSCTLDVDCNGGAVPNLCSYWSRCVAGLCVQQAPVDCSTTPGAGPCQVATCISTTGTCGLTPQADGSWCDDGDACTTGETCQRGTCTGGSTACDDGNPCTTDRCTAAEGCTNTPIAAGAPCAASNRCLTNAVCDVYGQCNGTPVECEDGNPCTTDVCEPATGCVHATYDGGCDDGNPCTAPDTCTGGVCSAVPLPEGSACWFPNPCVVGGVCRGGVCDGAGPAPDGGSCATEDRCVENTHCVGGECAGGTPIVCPDDGNPCTVESCDPARGCTVTAAPPGTECGVPDACTVRMTCTNLECGAREPQPNGTPCEDGNPCTAGQTCQSGYCNEGTRLGEGTPCEDADPCTQITVCRWGACTVDAYAPDGSPCDDGDPCTENDACNETRCFGTARVCDDGDACTADACDPSVGCVSSPVTSSIPCDDHDPCTIEDFCDGATCLGREFCDDRSTCTADTCEDGTCRYAWLEDASCPREANCGDQQDDDGNGLVDCLQPSCKVEAARCTAARPLPDFLTFEAAVTPGFGTEVDLRVPSAARWAVDATPADPVAYSGLRTLNFNDGATAGFLQDGSLSYADARLCCWDVGETSVPAFVTWVEWVDLPLPGDPDVPEPLFFRRARIVTPDGVAFTDATLETSTAERGQWVRRVIATGGTPETFGVTFLLGRIGIPWSGGHGWFIDDLEVLLAEDCANTVDDNGNAAIDCDDPLCELEDACRGGQ